jgi:cell division septation protein DedD
MTTPEFESKVFGTHTVVALIPATDDLEWAASAAWMIARAAAKEKPRVALIDLSLTTPALDAEAVHQSSEGIVDAFLYDTSLTSVAQPQDVPGLHYVGVGTLPPNPVDVWAHPRWEKLAKGFAHQGALLLVFIPPSAIPSMTLKPDGMLVMSTSGWDPAGGMFREITEWWEKGVALLSVVSGAKRRPSQDQEGLDSGAPPPHYQVLQPVEPPEGAATTGETPVGVPVGVGSGIPRPSRTRPTFTAVNGSSRRWRAATSRVVIGVLILVGSLFVVRRVSRSPGDGDDAAMASFPVSPEEARATGLETAPPPPEPAPAVELDSLYYSIQVAAFDRSDRAIAYAGSLERGALMATVTPVRIGGGLWHRVILGALPTAEAADTALRALWRDGLVEDGNGTILRTPQALDLGTRETLKIAQQEVADLRARGIPAYSMAAPLGQGRVLVGAFETADQIAVAESLLTAAGLTASLVTRTGIVP